MKVCHEELPCTMRMTKSACNQVASIPESAFLNKKDFCEWTKWCVWQIWLQHLNTYIGFVHDSTLLAEILVINEQRHNTSVHICCTNP